MQVISGNGWSGESASDVEVDYTDQCTSDCVSPLAFAAHHSHPWSTVDQCVYNYCPWSNYSPISGGVSGWRSTGCRAHAHVFAPNYNAENAQICFTLLTNDNTNSIPQSKLRSIRSILIHSVTTSNLCFTRIQLQWLLLWAMKLINIHE